MTSHTAMNKPADLLPCHNEILESALSQIKKYHAEGKSPSLTKAEREELIAYLEHSLPPLASPTVLPEDEKLAERMRGYVRGITDNNTATALELVEANAVIAELVEALEHYGAYAEAATTPGSWMANLKPYLVKAHDNAKVALIRARAYTAQHIAEAEAKRIQRENDNTVRPGAKENV